MKALLTLINTLATTPHLHTEDEHALYNAAMRFATAQLREAEILARMKEILAEKELDELRNTLGDCDGESM